MHRNLMVVRVKPRKRTVEIVVDEVAAAVEVEVAALAAGIVIVVVAVQEAGDIGERLLLLKMDKFFNSDMTSSRCPVVSSNQTYFLQERPTAFAHRPKSWRW